jgi:hypothetical protein
VNLGIDLAYHFNNDSAGVSPGIVEPFARFAVVVVGAFNNPVDERHRGDDRIERPYCRGEYPRRCGKWFPAQRWVGLIRRQLPRHRALPID